MNERIQQLYLQAHTVRTYDGDPAREGNPPTVYWQDEVSAEKFAELIIRECLGLLGSESAYGKQHIKKHFGVSTT